MARKKPSSTAEESPAWGYHGAPPAGAGDRSPAAFAELVRTTKLRTLGDMTEREIRELERFYGCPVQRPGAGTKRRRRATGGVRAAAA